ncbi:hypothetical protein FBY40_1881 [Microbacterium sp. SLBN-154]|uniref:DUF6716 putative glycosyltransferase n=1 Tax=Microbacterium sp. SLBN-154 TaxID=2768458 RepID=UPI001153A838|nr:DUF6716 putative glycosyltransferase [Microbacterium sp. SLBN-154]TQK19383.1 hypothetical protein FBY40_1881 [Microbacterium sp. SLBN-154]
MTGAAAGILPPRRIRVVGIADTDSYVKWAAALVGSAPATWDRSMRILDTPLAVSDDQLRAALTTSGLSVDAVARLTLAQLEESVADDPPDVVIIGARGPLARVLVRLFATLPGRPVVVTGLPGISVPATRKALFYRQGADLFVVHSRRERTEFAALSATTGLPHRFALATLPFAAAAARAGGQGRAPEATDIVFAAQAIVPSDREDRVRLAGMLRSLASADSSRRVVVKLRAAAGEHQTHLERDAFPELLRSLGESPENLVLSTAPMQAALDQAAGLVTVSSTAAIEAIARGIPVLALDTFGVSPALINVVFEGSGLLGGEDDLLAGRFRLPAASWLRENYLHDPAEDDWIPAVERMVGFRRQGLLAHPALPTGRGGRLRLAWERKSVFGEMDRSPAGRWALAVGVPARTVVRTARRVRTRLQVSRSAGPMSSR